MSNVNFQLPYSDAEAERGKFVVVDDTKLSSLFNYPTTGRGKYAVLVKDIDQAPNSATTTSAFGEPISVELTPVIQLDGIYGISAEMYEQYSSGTGSVLSNDLMEVRTGTGQFGYGVLRSKRTVRYRPGQGAMARFTAKFSEGAIGYIQRAGFFSQEQALQIGYQDDQFGIIRQNTGKAQIVEFRITTPAAGFETFTLTLNDVPYILNVNSTTAQVNVGEIQGFGFSGWTTSYKGSSVYFVSDTLGPKTGTYSIANTGSLSGQFTTLKTGIQDTVEFIPQSGFNLDKLDGTGSSNAIINPQKLNVYQINFRWLGAGEIRFAMENPESGELSFFHKIKWSNKNETPHIDNPSMKIGYVAASLGGQGTDIMVSGASMMGAIEGKIVPARLPKSVEVIRTTGLSTGNVTHHLLTIKNDLVTNETINKINLRESILKYFSAGIKAGGGNPCLATLYLNATTSSILTYDQVGSCSTVSKTAALITSGTKLATWIVPDGGNINIDLSNLNLILPPSSYISIGLTSTVGINSAEVSLIFIED